MQEISSFNPVPSRYGDFAIEKDEVLMRRRGLDTAIGMDAVGQSDPEGEPLDGSRDTFG